MVIDKRIKKSLRYSVYDGIFNSLKIGFGESFFAPYAIFLNASNFQIGLLGSLPQALGSVSQAISNKLIRFFKSRKKFVLTAVFFEALMYFPVAFVFFFSTLNVFHLIFFVSLYWIFSLIHSAAWNSWMGDLVDENKRGSYFGLRNKLGGFASFIGFLLGGFILEKFSLNKFYGFLIIFCLAFLSRVMSFIYLSKKFEPEYKVIKGAEFGFVDFIKQARFRNYGLFVIYLSLMNFSIYFAGPYFTAYMLNDLRFSYLTFTIITATSIIVKYIAMPIWGKFSDRFGSKKVLSTTGYLIPFVALFWVFSHNFWWLMIIQVFSGFIWAGFEISSFNFIFDTTTPQKRATCVAYFNVLNGFAIFSGAMAGSFIMNNNVFWSPYLLVFLVSFILRGIFSLIFLPKLKEVRNVKHIPSHSLILKVISNMPTMGMIHDLIVIRKIKRFK